MSQVLISLENVVKELGGRRILDRLTWELREGECAVILGPSGSGKSVFLHTLLGLLQPDAGEVKLPALDEQDRFRSIAVMFQEDALLDERSVEANLAVARCERADLFSPPFGKEVETAIDEVLTEVQLAPGRVRRVLPSALSGGMRRRVALARALIRQPRVLIADEPTTGLDPVASARVYDILGDLIERRGMSAIIITHDPSCASRLGFPVYFFSPVEGNMPKWPIPDVSRDDPQHWHEERHRSLLLWMHEQIEAHFLRQESEEGSTQEPTPPPAAEWNLAAQGRERLVHPILDGLGRAGLLLGRLGNSPSAELLRRNLFLWGLGSAPLTALIFVMLGMVIEVQAELGLIDYGLSNRIPELVALSLLRMSPILTGFLLAGRCGSAIGAQVGFMELSGQARALHTMRMTPDRTLFPPLFWSLLIATPLLALLGLAIGGLGALIPLSTPISQARLTSDKFLVEFPKYLEPAQLALLAVKGMLIGGGLATVAYALGRRPKRSPADVTRAITLTLVVAFVWITLVDTILSLLVPL